MFTSLTHDQMDILGLDVTFWGLLLRGVVFNQSIRKQTILMTNTDRGIHVFRKPATNLVALSDARVFVFFFGVVN